MYSESDLDGAVQAGVLRPEAATAFRAWVAAAREAPAVDEEHFRLLTGFNDIFVSIALCLSLAAIAWIGGSFAAPLAGAGVAAASWMLAEYFTARRRMALPSILLLIAFVGGVAGTLFGVAAELVQNPSDRVAAMIGAVVALVTAGAAWIHWWRFMVPITVAAGALALVGLAVSLLLAAVPAVRELVWPLLLAGGIAVFVLAMRWDLSDRDRTTRRSDVAFWLHLAAAPLIAHPVFQLLGVFSGEMGAGKALVAVALYLAFAAVALAVDRRALLVSSLVYVLYALGALFRGAGAVELGAAFTGLVIGSALLMLSAFWQPFRRRVIGAMGHDWANRLPPVAQAA